MIGGGGREGLAAAAMRGAVAGCLVAGIALPAAGRFAALGLAALAGLAFARRGSAPRELPPSLLAAYLCLLLALAHARIAGGAPALDRLAVLAAATLLAVFAPFYLADRLPPFPALLAGCLSLGFARHFEAAAAHLAGGGALAPLAPAAPFLAGAPTAALLLVAAAPFVESVKRPSSRIILELIWHALLLAAAPFRPGAVAALAAGLAFPALAGRAAAPARRLALALLLVGVQTVALLPGATPAARWHGFLEPARRTAAAALAALAFSPADVTAEAGPGFAALRKRLSAARPGGRLDEAEFARLPAALLFPLGPGIPAALLFGAFHLLLARRAGFTLGRLPPGHPGRPLASAGAGVSAALAALLLFTAEPLLTGTGAPFFFIAGSALALAARPTDPIPRRTAGEGRRPPRLT